MRHTKRTAEGRAERVARPRTSLGVDVVPSADGPPAGSTAGRRARRLRLGLDRPALPGGCPRAARRRSRRPDGPAHGGRSPDGGRPRCVGHRRSSGGAAAPGGVETPDCRCCRVPLLLDAGAVHRHVGRLTADALDALRHPQRRRTHPRRAAGRARPLAADCSGSVVVPEAVVTCGRARRWRAPGPPGDRASRRPRWPRRLARRRRTRVTAGHARRRPAVDEGVRAVPPWSGVLCTTF